MSDYDPIHWPPDEEGRRVASAGRWLLGLALLAAVPGVYVVSTSVERNYTAEGTILIQQESGPGSVDPVRPRAEALNGASTWIELLRSYQVLDQVVVDRGLNLRARGQSVQEASQELADRLEVAVAREGEFIRVRLNGSDPQQVESVLNSILRRYTELAAELKRGRVDAMLAVLEERLSVAGRELTEAERDLERLRGGTITLPSTRSPSPIEERSGTLPPRIIEEERLMRRVQTAATVYQDVRRRVQAAQVQAASAVPDVRIVDGPRLLDRRSDASWIPIAAATLFGCLIAVLGGALVLGRPETHSVPTGGKATGVSLSEDLGPLLVVIASGLLALMLTALVLM